MVRLCLLLTVVALAGAGCGGSEEAGPTTTTPTATTAPAEQGLPAAVAETRDAISHAAITNDYEALESLLDPETFSYSFGESGDPIGYWKEQEKNEIPVLGDYLPMLLHTRHAKADDIYVWPSAAAKEGSEWTAQDLQSMRQAGYSDEDIESFEELGSYLGRRAGIRADWQRVFAEAAATGKALEIDANARRQDLDLASVQLAVAEGVQWFSIGSDAHNAEELDFLPMGLAIAAAAGVPRDRVLNYLGPGDVIRWAAQLRG
jgi:hypothetical protein